MTPRSRSQSSGQTLPLFAIMAPGMLALMALGLDGAQIFLERRDAQGAADLAALAGVVHLPDDATDAKNTAVTNAGANGFPAGLVTATSPFRGDASKIEVVIDSKVDTFFMGILNMFAPGDYSKVDVSARAVAQENTTTGSAGSGGFAILGLEEGCGSDEKSVDVSGSDAIFIGRVHSNSDIHVSGSTNSFTGSTTHLCGIANVGGSNSYDPSPDFAAVELDPINRDYASLCGSPTYTGGSAGSDWDLTTNGPWWVGNNKDSKTLNPGTYCSLGKIKLGDQNITIADVNGESGITFAANKVEISGSDFFVTPHQDNILFAAFANTDDAMKVSGSGGDWAGLIYAPNGWVEMSGQNNGPDDFDLNGGIIGDRVKLNGSNANINGDIGGGPASPPVQTIALIE